MKKIEITRAKRYKEKLNLISKRIEEIYEWENSFLKDEKTKLACYKGFQEIIEASMDILAMLLKDENVIPKDDYSNIEQIYEKKIINNEIKNILKEANGLRNRIIHEYNGLNDKKAYGSVMEMLPSFTPFMDVIEKWLKSKL